MNNNQYVKSLKLFNPKKDLTVNEKFKPKGSFSTSDTLSDLESGDDGINGSETGKEFQTIKTSGSILSGIVKIDANEHNYLMVTNKAGEIIIIDPAQTPLKSISTFKIPGSIVRTPTYSDGIIYVTTREGMIFAINPGLSNLTEPTEKTKPKILWKQRSKKGILTEPISTGKVLIITTLGGLYAFEAYYRDDTNKSIGKTLWLKSIKGVVSTPRLYSGNIYVGSEDKNLYAFDYGGHKINQMWVHKSSGAIRMKPCVSGNGHSLVFSTVDGFVYCLDRNNGKYKWNYVTKTPNYSNIVTAKIGNNEYYLFGSDSGIFYCLNRHGKKLWQFKTNGKIRTEALISGNKIFFGSEDNNLYALNINNGKLIFKFSTDGNINGKPVIINDVIYFGSTDSFVHGVTI